MFRVWHHDCSVITSVKDSKNVQNTLQLGGEGSMTELKDGRQGRDKESSC